MFTRCIPQLPQPPFNIDAQPAHPEETSAKKAKRVLVVEDDATTGNALRQLLGACGHEVKIVGTVAAAQQVIDDCFDSVILDLMLPDGDGVEVLQKIRAAGLKTRVCITTGVSNPGWLGRARAMGADCVLQKPIDLSELLEKL